MTNTREDFPLEWLTSKGTSHVGDVVTRNVWEDAANGLVPREGTIVAFSPQVGRRPALYRWSSSDPGGHCQILTEQEVQAKAKNRVEPSECAAHIMGEIQERLDTNLHQYTVQHILPDLVLHALLEETWSSFLQQVTTGGGGGTSGSSSFVESTRPSYYTTSQVALLSTGDAQEPENVNFFSISALHQRIKSGVQMAYNYLQHHYNRDDETLRRSRRTTLPPRPSPHQKGGKVALYLLERLEGKSSLFDQDVEPTSESKEPKTSGAASEKGSCDETSSAPIKEGKVQEHDKNKDQNETGDMTNEKKSSVKAEASSEKEVDDGTTNEKHSQVQVEAFYEKGVDDDGSDVPKDSKPAASIGGDPTTATISVDDLPSNGDGAGTPKGDGQDNGTKHKQMKKIENDEKEKVILINAHEEEIDSEDDEDDKDDDFEVGTNDGTDVDDDDELKDVVKEKPQLDIDMEEENSGYDEEEDEEDDDDDGDYISNNPYLQPTPESLLDWIGRRGKSMSMVELQEAIGICLKASLALYDLSAMDQRAIGAKGDVFVLEAAEKWKDLKKYDASNFGRCKVRLKSDTEEEQKWIRQQEEEENHRKNKAWASWRYKSIHGSHTVWRSWTESVEEWIKDKKGEAPSAAAVQPADQAAQDETLAQSLAAEPTSTSSGRRSARRSAANEGGVFYGTQSSMSQKQLMETVARLSRQTNFQTMLGFSALVGDDSTNPVHRLRTALGRLIWKRNQIVECKVTSLWSDQPLWSRLQTSPLWTVDEDGGHDEASKDCANALAQYLRHLHQTELQLRNIILRQLTCTPLVVIATAADERAGTLESFDAADFEDPKSMKWKESGHAFIGKRIYRPAQQSAGSNSECRWFKIGDFVESVPWEEEGDDKWDSNGATVVERRMRFRAYPITEEGSEDYGDVLVLTQAQVAAGFKAGEKALEDSRKPTTLGHPFAGGVGTQVGLKAEDDVKQCIVVAYDTLPVGGTPEKFQHKTLLLPERRGEKEAFWVSTFTDNEGKLSCRIDGAKEPDGAKGPTIYKIEQSDYDHNSAAFLACRQVVDFLMNHKSSDIFMEPVDPVALNIPTYFEVIKRPMDISTLSANLEKGKFSKIPKGKSAGRSAVSRMLNGEFKNDALLIFDNAIAFNPPDDWIHITAKSMRKALLKKIELLSNEGDTAGSNGGGRRTTNSVYVDEDSDIDMYEYESDRDDEDFASNKRARKRKRKSGSKTDDVSLQAMEGPIRLRKTLSETLGLRGPFANLPIVSDSCGFSLQAEWGCRRQQKSAETEKQKQTDEQLQKELEEILSLQRAAEESEKASLRRSSRAHITEDGKSMGGLSASLKIPVAYYLLKGLPQLPTIVSPPEMLARSRAELETLLENAHESYYAKLYQRLSKDLSSDSMDGSFANAAFPPYLGRVLPASLDCQDGAWEIRSEYVVPAVRWVIRGLINSGHLSALEPLSLDTSFTSGIIMTSNVYYHDPSREPFDYLEIRRKKKEENGASSEDEIELSEYEKLRAERVARNAERLRMLGLA